MRWLLTVPNDADLTALARDLSTLGAEMTGDAPVPLDQHEQVVRATGPADLDQRIRDAGLPVVKVSPESDMTPF